MTPAVTGLVFAGLSELSTRPAPSLSHHIGRFFVAAAMVTFLLAGGLGAAGPQTTAHTAADARVG